MRYRLMQEHERVRRELARPDLDEAIIRELRAWDEFLFTHPLKAFRALRWLDAVHGVRPAALCAPRPRFALAA